MATLEELATPPKERKDKRSPLMRAKAASLTSGEKLNACPYGCELEDLDENGYCRHLVGFCNAEDNGKPGKHYEPQIFDEFRGRYKIDVPWKKVDGKSVPDLPLVLKTDKLIKITTSYRVYRDDPK